MKKTISAYVFAASLITLPIAASTLLTSCTAAPKQESTGQYLDSSFITAKVKSKLLADNIVKGLPISVKTYKNVVQLSGFVENQYQATRALEIARSVEGVVAVHNGLLIKNR